MEPQKRKAILAGIVRFFDDPINNQSYSFAEVFTAVNEKLDRSEFPIESIESVRLRVFECLQNLVNRGQVLKNKDRTYTSAVASPTQDTPSTSSVSTDKKSAKKQAREKKFKATKAKAKRGDADAQYEVGEMFLRGKGKKKCKWKAYKWFERSANQGHRDAQNQIGDLLLAGKGVAKNSDSAFYWYAQSAEQGQADAQYATGLAFLDGRTVYSTRKDEERALKWFSKAANQGHYKAKKMVTKLTEEGVVEAEDIQDKRPPNASEIFWKNMSDASVKLVVAAGLTYAVHSFTSVWFSFPTFIFAVAYVWSSWDEIGS